MTDQRAEQVRNDFASAILGAAGEWLPLSVRYAAADAAIAVVSAWQGRDDGVCLFCHDPLADHTDVERHACELAAERRDLLGLATTGELLQELEARFEFGGFNDGIVGAANVGAHAVIHRLIANLELTPEVLTYRTVDA